MENRDTDWQMSKPSQPWAVAASMPTTDLNTSFEIRISEIDE